MEIYLTFVFLFIGVPLLFFAMFKVARWSRIKNEELKEKNEDSQKQALEGMLQGKMGSIVNYYTSSMPKSASFVGNFLAVGVIIFFLILALILVLHVYKSI